LSSRKKQYVKIRSKIYGTVSGERSLPQTPSLEDVELVFLVQMMVQSKKRKFFVANVLMKQED